MFITSLEATTLYRSLKEFVSEPTAKLPGCLLPESFSLIASIVLLANLFLLVLFKLCMYNFSRLTYHSLILQLQSNGMGWDNQIGLQLIDGSPNHNP